MGWTSGRTDGRMVGPTDGRTVGRTDGRADGRTDTRRIHIIEQSICSRTLWVTQNKGGAFVFYSLLYRNA